MKKWTPGKLSSVVFVIYFLAACSSTNVFNKSAQLTDVTSSWLYENCIDSDWRNSSNLNYKNCKMLTSEVNGVAYSCDFNNSRAVGLFRDSGDLRLLCGVRADGIENSGVVYTNGDADTSIVGKALVATAVAAVAAAAVTAVKNSNYTQPKSYTPSYYTPIKTPSCQCPYDRAVDGSRCGARSAWSRSGGNEPSCNIELITFDDILEKQ